MPNGSTSSIAAWPTTKRTSPAPKRPRHEPWYSCFTTCGAGWYPARRLSTGAVRPSANASRRVTNPPQVANLPHHVGCTSPGSPRMKQSEPLFAELAAPAAPTLRPGFRLHRVEVLNWGTFHKQVWGLDLGGNNALLTGDIGSGKSTFVDAVTALLVPRANFNKAAGALTGERSLETYFFGRYKSERGEPGLSSKPVSLRGPDSYSVLLCRFFNEALAQHVTLAQVFWAKAPQGPPARLFVIADRPLSITEHFAGFGADINTLRKRLRAMPQVELFETFPPYGSPPPHRFGIEHEQAMDLFHQTISMKSVGNLTDFVREHMLEASSVEERIQALIGHYQDLDRAHELVLKAKEQVGFLTPLVAACDERGQLAAKVDTLRACREALRPWFATRAACPRSE